MDPSQFDAEYPGQLVTIGEWGHAFVPQDIPPAWSAAPSLQRLHDTAMLRLGELRAVIPSLPNPKLLTSSFLRREAVLSSRIEGTHTEIEQLILFEVSEPSSRRNETEEEQDAREVLNYVRALEYGWKYLLEDARPQANVGEARLRNLSQWLIRGMHEVLMRGVRGQDKQPGTYRNCQAHIGASKNITLARYVPPPPEHLESRMANLESFLNADSILPSLVAIAVAHYQFEAIHPFADGNGRIGRLLITLMLLRWDLLPEPLLYLSAYFERHRSDYNDCLWQVSRCGDWNSWIEFFLVGVITEAEDAIGRAKCLLQLRENWRTRIQTIRQSGTLLQLLDRLFAVPVVSVNEASRLLEMSFQGAQKNITKLQELGFLVETTGQQRNRLFLAKPVVELLNEQPIARRRKGS